MAGEVTVNGQVMDKPGTRIAVDAQILLADAASVITLIKPQFEAGKQDVGKGGVVRSTAVHRRVLGEVLQAAQTDGFSVAGLIRSPLKGPAGNVEFLAWLRYPKQADDQT